LTPQQAGRVYWPRQRDRTARYDLKPHFAKVGVVSNKEDTAGVVYRVHRRKTGLNQALAKACAAHRSVNGNGTKKQGRIGPTDHYWPKTTCANKDITAKREKRELPQAHIALAQTRCSLCKPARPKGTRVERFDCGVMLAVVGVQGNKVSHQASSCQLRHKVRKGAWFSRQCCLCKA
jgi:hypothetical protein